MTNSNTTTTTTDALVALATVDPFQVRDQVPALVAALSPVLPGRPRYVGPSHDEGVTVSIGRKARLVLGAVADLLGDNVFGAQAETRELFDGGWDANAQEVAERLDEDGVVELRDGRDGDVSTLAFNLGLALYDVADVKGAARVRLDQATAALVERIAHDADVTDRWSGNLNEAATRSLVTVAKAARAAAALATVVEALDRNAAARAFLTLRSLVERGAVARDAIAAAVVAADKASGERIGLDVEPLRRRAYSTAYDAETARARDLRNIAVEVAEAGLPLVEVAARMTRRDAAAALAAAAALVAEDAATLRADAEETRADAEETLAEVEALADAVADATDAAQGAEVERLRAEVERLGGEAGAVAQWRAAAEEARAEVETLRAAFAAYKDAAETEVERLVEAREGARAQADAEVALADEADAEAATLALDFSRAQAARRLAGQRGELPDPGFLPRGAARDKRLAEDAAHARAAERVAEAREVADRLRAAADEAAQGGEETL